jgi:hypothetical protein
LDINKKRDPKVKGGSCRNDRSDTRDEWWIGNFKIDIEIGITYMHIS